jgi:hypothetical protein
MLRYIGLMNLLQPTVLCLFPASPLLGLLLRFAR